MLSYNELIEENLGLVIQVIKDQVQGANHVGIFTYEDLIQIGRVGLCKAARSYKPPKAKFATYAYTVIRNEIFDALEYVSVRKSLEPTDDFEIVMSMTATYDDPIENQLGLETLLNTLQKKSSGTISKGIEALKLYAQGLSYKEIGETFGVTANNVTAWASRARKYLLNNPEILALRESV